MVGATGVRARLGALAATAVALGVVFAALGGGSAAGGAPTLGLRSVGSFDSPIYVTSAPGATGFLYVVEQGGTIGVVDHGSVLAQPFLDIHRRVQSGGEQGLLSMAFDPRYQANHLLYVAYTRSDGALEIDEFHAPTNTHATNSSRRQVIVIPHPGDTNHNAGQLQFGPDGYLYISTGDGGGGGDSHDNARKLNVLSGKLLRINPHRRAGSPYAVPASNPYVGRAGRDEIFAYGFRNPWRFSFDSANGNLAIADVGQGAWEEIDYVTRSRARGSYFGWPTYEGIVSYDPSRPDPNPHPRQPVFPIKVASHDNGYRAIIGGFVVHNPSLSLLDGRYVYSDNARGDIRTLVARTGGASANRATGLSVSSPSSFGVGWAGQLYVASLGDGKVYRIVQQP